MSSSLIYKALVNGASEIEVTPQDLESLDLSVIDGLNMHVIQDQLGYRVRVVEADYEARTFILDIGGEQVQIQLKDTVELQAEAMGFERGLHEFNITDAKAFLFGLSKRLLHKFVVFRLFLRRRGL